MILPTVKITLEGMRQQVLHVFSEQLDGLKEGIEEELNKQIKNFNVEQEVKEIARSIIQYELKKVVENSIREAFWSESFLSVFRPIVQEAITNFLKEKQ